MKGRKKPETEHRATKPARQRGGGGAATTREQPMARQDTKLRRERTESREAGGSQNKQPTAPRPRAPGVGNQRKPETTEAHNERKKKRAARGSDEGRETRKGGAATSREQPTAGWETQTRRESTESREAGGQKNKQHTAPRPRAPGAGNQRKPETTEAHNERKKERARRGSDENCETRKGGGGGGSNHQGAANGRVGNTNEAREHGERRSGRPTTQAAHSAKAQGTRGWKPERARDKGGAQKEKKTTGRGGGGKKNKCQGPRHPGRKTKESN